MQRRRAGLPILSIAVASLALVGCGGAAEPETGEDTSAPEAPALGAELVTDELAVPREVIDLGDGTLLVSDQAGTVVVIEDGEVRDEPFLDVTGRIMPPTSASLELGLAGFEVAPDFDESGIVYTFTTEESDAADRVDRLLSWRADPESLVVDPDSATVILEHEAQGLDHVGGEIEIDDDGLLYTGFGSPGAGVDAQDPDDLAGTIIRIDPTGAAPYGIPDDNPFVDGGGLPEIYSLGYRNPWRLDWDAELGLVVAEAMWTGKHQQVSVPSPGDNAGYPDVGRATPECWVDGEVQQGCDATPEGDPIAPPVLEYGPDVGQIVSAAVVVQGADIAALDGAVLVADWEGSLLAAQPGEAPWPWQELPGVELDQALLWDAQQAGDGIYAMATSSSMSGGALYRLVES